MRENWVSVNLYVGIVLRCLDSIGEYCTWPKWNRCDIVIFQFDRCVSCHTITLKSMFDSKCSMNKQYSQRLFLCHKRYWINSEDHRPMKWLRLNLVFEEPSIEQHKPYNNNDFYNSWRETKISRLFFGNPVIPFSYRKPTLLISSNIFGSVSQNFFPDNDEIS